jgi:hypothetical protein
MITIEIRPHPIPAATRLKRFLKLMLRGFGFKCIAVDEIKQLERNKR